MLERVSITIDPDLLSGLDDLVARAGHANRSEVIRDLVRARLVESIEAEHVVAATLSVVYDHARRALADTLVEIAHAHHDLVLSTLHVHLDHDRCLEITALRGPLRALRDYAAHATGLKGVLHGTLAVMADLT